MSETRGDDRSLDRYQLQFAFATSSKQRIRYGGHLVSARSGRLLDCAHIFGKIYKQPTFNTRRTHIEITTYTYLM